MKRPRIVTGPLGFVIALALTGLACVALLELQASLDVGQDALVLVLVVWASAALAGVWPGMLAAAASFAAMSYFFVPPHRVFSLGRAQDLLTLAVFVIVAGVQGLQTGRMREREERAVEGEREAEAIAVLAAQLVSESSAAAVGELMTREVSRATGATRVAVFVDDGSGRLVRLTAPGSDEVGADAGVERFARWVMEHGMAVGTPPAAFAQTETDASMPWPRFVSHGSVVPGASRSDLFLPVSIPTGVEGVLYIGGLPNRRALSAQEIRLAVSLAWLLGAFLERNRLQVLASTAETLREAERLKATLMSSVSHELKTPLAAMTATVSGLLAEDTEPDLAQVRSDLAIVDEGLRRLSASISDLLDLSRLESDSWRARREPYDVAEIIGALVGRLEETDRGRVTVDIPDDLPPVEVDFVQWSRALSNVLENALSYSGPAGRVSIGARRAEGAVATWIEDDGPGISADEREKVFEKFYRGAASGRVPSGTGLGLTIAQEIVRFNGGGISIESAWPHGARVLVFAPTAAPAEAMDEASAETTAETTAEPPAEAAAQT
jgi:two-component system sensor histidine kinase KdpD